MNRLLKIIRIALMVFMCNLTYAHNSNEIIYKVVVDHEQQRLIINLTPSAAINLLQQLNLELKSEKEVQLENYLNEFEIYFNKTIDLKIDAQSVDFQLVDHQLKGHDATLTFSLKNLPTTSTQFEITITSFLTVYDRVMNIVRVDLNGKKTNCILDNNIRTCTTENQVVLIDFLRANLCYVLIPLVISLVLLFFFKRKKISASKEES